MSSNFSSYGIFGNHVKVFIVIVLLCFQINSVNGSSFSCKDENGNDVDGWVGIKQFGGYEYYYYTSSTWKKSKYLLDQTSDGMVMKTLQPLYNANTTEIAYAIYNDEYPPQGKSASSTYAHAKGIIMTGSTQGFWLVHSMPNWPNRIEDGIDGFPDDTYSQSMECVTLSVDNVNKVATGMMLSRPWVYDSSPGTSEIQKDMPDFTTWVGGSHTTSDEPLTIQIKSVAGHTYTVFEKSKTWGKDIWDDLVAPYYKSAMNVETWRSGSGGRIGSICQDSNKDSNSDTDDPPKTDKYDIMEVAEVAMPDGITWTGTHDHSKWSSGIDEDFFCIGDLNRMCSQESRGGGALCRSNSYINNAFNSIINSVEKCWEYDPCGGTYGSCYWCSADKTKVEEHY